MSKIVYTDLSSARTGEAALDLLAQRLLASHHTVRAASAGDRHSPTRAAIAADARLDRDAVRVHAQMVAYLHGKRCAS